MSRNVRQKYPQTPVKAAKRRGSDTSSSLNLSDDEHGYSAVEDVSDSDDEDEEHVFAAEEEHILNSAARKRSHGTPRPLETLVEDDDADEEAEDDDDVEEENEEDAADENASWNGILSEHDVNTNINDASHFFDEEMTSVERHVRFTGVPDSDSDSTLSEASEDRNNDFFPDIFVEQTTLDPGFRREIENEVDDDSSSISGSFWDYHTGAQDLIGATMPEDDDVTPTATPMPSGAQAEVSTPPPSGDDGYESDGDTTEEDIPEPQVRRKQMRRLPRVELSSDSETEEEPTPFRQGKPRVRRFRLNSGKKPVAVLNPKTKKMMIFTPQRANRLDLSPESFNIDLLPDLSNCSPILNPGYIMMGAMPTMQTPMISSNAFTDFISMTPFGPTEAFFPTTSDPPVGESSEESEFIPEEDEAEGKLKLEDFITYDDSTDGEENGGEFVEDWTVGEESSPTRPRTAASGVSAATDSSAPDVHPLLSHFDNNSNTVSAFRRNQIHQQLILSDKASQESLAFSSPYHYGTLRGIKSGSLETVTTPITPVRRQKRSQTISTHGLELQSSPSQKRKASSTFTDSLHKKQRSISDVGVLQLS